jgi:two-component system cell cycle sensor histidine kinase/response regulator CckA
MSKEEGMSKNSKSDRLSIDQVNRLEGQSILGISTTAINSTTLSLALWGITPKSKIVLWLFAALTISLIRILLQLRFRKTATTSENILKRKYYLLIALAVSGCIWGSAGIFLFPSSSIAHQVFIAFVLGGMVAGSVGVFASIMAAFYSFSIPAVLPIIVNFFYINSDIHFAMGAMAAIFWFIMLMTAKRLNREIVEFLKLKYENIDLISNLEKEVGERKSAEEKLLIRNQQIEAIVQDRTAELINVNEKLLMEIEDRKEAEKALRDSEEKYRELANSLPQIVFETDEQGNLTFTNRNANKLFGYTEKDFSEGLNNF